MRSLSNVAKNPVVTIDEALLTRLAWVATGSALAAVLLFSNWYVLVAVAAGVAAAVAATSYAENETTADYEVPLNDAWISAIDALADNGFAFDSPIRHGVTEGRLRAGIARVDVERHPKGVTRVRVRVGLFSTADNRRRAALVVERLSGLLARETPTVEIAA